MAELLAANQITIAKVLDGADGEMSAEQLAQLNQASEDASQAKTDVANLEIGGRNILPFEQWANRAPHEKNGSIFVLTKGLHDLYSNPYVFGEVGTEYTFSAKPHSQDSTFFRADIGTYDGTTFTVKDKLALGSDGAYKSVITRNDVNAIRLNYSTATLPFIVDSLKIEKGNKATDWTPAPEDVEAGIKNAQTGVDSLNDSVFGVQTFEYVLDGVTIPVHKREDGTYYYILNDAEVTVAESDLVHDADGDLVSYQEGGIYEDLDVITGDIDAIDKKVDGFDARADALHSEIQDNSLIARKNARVVGDSLIITNDTATGDVGNLLNYLQLNPTSIVIYGNGKDIVTIAKTNQDSGYMEMKGTSLFIAQESRLSTIRLRSADNIGKLALVAGSDGHVSLKEVLD